MVFVENNQRAVLLFPYNHKLATLLKSYIKLSPSYIKLSLSSLFLQLQIQKLSNNKIPCLIMNTEYICKSPAINFLREIMFFTPSLTKGETHVYSIFLLTICHNAFIWFKEHGHCNWYMLAHMILYQVLQEQLII